MPDVPAIYFTIPDIKIGTCSWYDDKLAGRLMSNGHPYDPEALTCASWDYPLGAILLVDHLGCKVRVVVTDRGPSRELYLGGRILDLSKAAFRELSYLQEGVVNVTITKL